MERALAATRSIRGQTYELRRRLLQPPCQPHDAGKSRAPAFPETAHVRLGNARGDGDILPCQPPGAALNVERFVELPRVEPQHFARVRRDRKSTRLNSSHLGISYAV